MGAIAGGIIGAIVVIILLAGLLWCLFRRRKPMSQGTNDSHTQHSVSLGKHYFPAGPMQELPDNSRIVELDGNPRTEIGPGKLQEEDLKPR